MNISYGTTINVMNCGARMLDLIDHNLNTLATGDEYTVVTYGDVEDWLEESKNRNLPESQAPYKKELKKFLKQVIARVDEKKAPFGDVVFSK
jgi:hypothetical protein